MKTAIALFVKDEAQDIAGWIAWHLALGADRLFIYDDHSNDGTWEILQAAAKRYDAIELARSDLHMSSNFFWRQATCYKDACRKATGQFDWIGFLDGDEYVSLETADSLNAFLEQFSDYNGVTLSWRIYGSSHRALKSRQPAYEAYTFHCGPDLGDCELGKVFIRPQDFTDHYENPHRIALTNERYANAMGQPVTWRGPTHDVIWQGGCINHYIVRSMENYIERIRRRVNADLADSTGYWQHFDRNDIHRRERPQFIERAGKILVHLREACVDHYLRHVTQQGLSSSPESGLACVYSILTHNNVPLILDHPEGRVAQKAGEESVPVTAAVYRDDPHVYLFVEQYGHIASPPFRVREDGRFRSSLAFCLEAAPTEGRWFLRQEGEGKFLVFFPVDGDGTVEAIRDSASDWEECLLIAKQEQVPVFAVSPHHIRNRHDFLEYLRQNAGRLTYDDFVLALNLLTDHCRTELFQTAIGKSISWI